MEMILLNPQSSEWDFIWQWLEDHPLNEGLEDKKLAKNENEGWQYMGSWRQGENVVSEFRHRNHPLTQSMHNLSVSHTVKEESIFKKNKLK